MISPGELKRGMAIELDGELWSVQDWQHNKTGRGGAITHAVSGIDIALWDILGQATGQPVGRLLGGCYRDKIKPYGSLLFDEPDALRRKLEDAVSRGFKALKLKLLQKFQT